MPQLSANGARFFMLIGDEGNRLSEMRKAVEELAQNFINHRFEILPGGSDHNDLSMLRSNLMRGIDYVLFAAE